MWGEKAYNLIKELERSRVAMKLYDAEAVREIVDECHKLKKSIDDMKLTTFHRDTNNFVVGVRVRHAAIMRNKRCLLTYHWYRLENLKKMRWEFGSVLPPEMQSNLSLQEMEWFASYNKSLAKFMKTVGGSLGMDLTRNVNPPKDLCLEVRCLADFGKFELEDGEIVILNRNSQYLLPRSQCEGLILRGILQHVL